MEVSETKFKQAEEAARKYYKALEPIKCPYFNEAIHFNSEGWKHIFFKKGNIRRSVEDQYMRLKLLPLAEQVLRRSHTLQQYYETKSFERVQSNSVWATELKAVRYYAFSAVINNALIKVVIKQIEGRNKNFHSIIPKWYVKEQEGKKKKIFHTGNLEED